MAEGLTTSDVLAMRNYDDHDRYCDDGMFGGNGSWVFFLFFLLAWGGGGFGWGNRGNEYLTQAEMQRGFDTQAIITKLDGLSNGLCDGFYAQNTTMLQGFNTVGRAIDQARFDSQQCCYNGFMVA